MILAPEVECRPWAEQLALDDASYRKQLAYLVTRSSFYREKLKAAGFATAEGAGGLGDIAGLPLTEKSELKATCTPDNPIGSCCSSARWASSPAVRARIGTALTALAGKPTSSITAAIGIDTFMVSGLPQASAAASRSDRASAT